MQNVEYAFPVKTTLQLSCEPTVLLSMKSWRARVRMSFYEYSKTINSFPKKEKTCKIYLEIVVHNLCLNHVLLHANNSLSSDDNKEQVWFGSGERDTNELIIMQMLLVDQFSVQSI